MKWKDSQIYNGTWKRVFRMGKEKLPGQMAIIIKAILKMVHKMEKELYGS
jgi:hypothetical protein